MAALLDLPCGTRQRRRNAPPDRCRFPHAARLHPPYAPRRAHRRQLCLRGLSGRVRGGGARPFLPMRRRGLRGLGAGGRLDFGLHVDPCEFPSGQYLPRPLLGGVAVVFRTLPRPGVDAPRRVCRLRGFPLLPGRRNAFARRRRRVALLPLQPVVNARCAVVRSASGLSDPGAPRRGGFAGPLAGGERRKAIFLRIYFVFSDFRLIFVRS